MFLKFCFIKIQNQHRDISLPKGCRNSHCFFLYFNKYCFSHWRGTGSLASARSWRWQSLTSTSTTTSQVFTSRTCWNDRSTSRQFEKSIRYVIINFRFILLTLFKFGCYFILTKFKWRSFIKLTHNVVSWLKHQNQ